MSLEGNLTAFGLSEILQLIAVQQKSGMLSVKSEAGNKVLFFRNGQMISTRDRRRNAKDPLRDFLTRYGILSREDLLRLTNISTESKLDLTDIIVSEGVLSEEQMQRHFRDHLQEECHELLTWEQCSYKFLPGNDIVSGIKTWGEFSIEGMLMESMRRIDEFPQILEALPDVAARIRKTGEPKEDQELTSNEKTVHGLLDRERTLSHLIGHGKMPQYETYEAVRHLHEKGLVEIDLAEGASAAREAEVGKRIRRKRARKNPLPFVLSFLLFGASMAWGVHRVTPHVSSFFTGGSHTESNASSVLRNRTESRLRWALEAHYARNGSYPGNLNALKSDGLVNDAFLKSVDSFAFRYRLTENGRRYTLL